MAPSACVLLAVLGTAQGAQFREGAGFPEGLGGFPYMVRGLAL